MKKIILNLAFIFTIGVLSLVNVSAASFELIREEVEDVYFTATGNGEYISYQAENYYIDGKTVYCAELGEHITTLDYYETDGFSSSPYTDEVNYLLELIGHYGYGYLDHDTLNYKLATQALIWEVTKDVDILYYTKQYGYGDLISVDEEKEEILSLIENHEVTPSFDVPEDVLVGEEISLLDSLGVLPGFEITSVSGANAEIKNDSLVVTSSEVGQVSITLSKINYNEGTTMFYVNENYDTQIMASLYQSEVVSVTLKINAVGGSIAISKESSVSSLNEVSALASLENAVYGVYSLDDELIFSVTTDEFGYVQSENVLAKGDYYLKEIAAPTGYVLSDEIYYFSIGEENANIFIHVIDPVITSSVLITKVDSVSKEALSGALIEVTNEFDEVVFYGETDENGEIYLENLVYGSYFVTEVMAPDGYDLTDEVISFSVENDDEIINLVMENDKTEITVIKVPNTYKNDYYVSQILGSMCLIMGFGLFKNEKKFTC